MPKSIHKKGTKWTKETTFKAAAISKAKKTNKMPKKANKKK